MSNITVRYKQDGLCTIIGHTYTTHVYKTRYGAYLVIRECAVCGKITKALGKDTPYAKE